MTKKRSAGRKDEAVGVYDELGEAIAIYEQTYARIHAAHEPEIQTLVHSLPRDEAFRELVRSIP